MTDADPAPLPLTSAERDALDAGSAPPGTVLAQDLDLSGIVQGWSSATAGTWVGREHAIAIGGRTFATGIGTHAVSRFTIHLRGGGIRFAAMVGVDVNNRRNDAPAGAGSVRFAAWGDGRLLARSGVLRGGDPPLPFAVDLRGISVLVLEVDDAGDGTHWDHAAWAGAFLHLAPGTALHATPSPCTVVPQIAPTPIRLPAPPLELHGPGVVGGTPGRAFVHRLGATGPAGIRFAVTGLPDSLSLDPETGVIAGHLPATPGEHRLHLTARAGGSETCGELRLVCGPGRLAQTPLMGWNSWNAWGMEIDAAKIDAACEVLVASGLAALGYRCVNIDDGWQGTRDADGVLQPHAGFGDMAALAARVHRHGLRLGIYSSPGPLTCGGRPGSYGHEALDARTWAAWGIDLLKHDWCSYKAVAGEHPTRGQAEHPYRLMRQALDACDRDIAYAVCQYGLQQAWEWAGGPDINAQQWRVAGDLFDRWDSLLMEAESAVAVGGHAGPGHWNDPDMLVVGSFGWGAQPRPTRLTPVEQQTHLGLWAMLAAPLLISCDLTRLDDFTRDLLGNPEIIALDQDPLGVPARCAVRTASGWLPPAGRVWAEVDTAIETWIRPLADGGHAVALFNRSGETAEIACNWADLGIAGRWQVRDLWRRDDLGIGTWGWSAQVPAHGALILRLREA